MDAFWSNLANKGQALLNDVQTAWNDLNWTEQMSLNAHRAIFQWAENHKKPNDAQNQADHSQLSGSLNLSQLGQALVNDREVLAPESGVVAGVYKERGVIALALSPDTLIALEISSPEQTQMLVSQGQFVAKGQPLMRVEGNQPLSANQLLLVPNTPQNLKMIENA